MNKVLKNKSKILLVTAALFAYIILLLASQDNDMFFEIASGRDILAGNFKTVSKLNDFPVVIQQWLYCAILAIFDKLGYAGHILFVLIQDIILWILSSVFIYRKTKNKTLAIYSPLFMLVYCSAYMINIRPQIITMIFLVAQVLLLDYYYEKKQTKYLVWLVPLLILAANFHQGVFLYHIFILIPFYLTEDKKIDWKLVAFTPFYMTCSLCTPYFIDGSLYVFKSLSSKVYSFFVIPELKQLDILTFTGVKTLAVVVIVTWLLYKRKANKFTYFYTYSIFLFSMTKVRHISILYFAILWVVCCIDFSIIKEIGQYIAAALLFGLGLIGSYTVSDKRNDFGDILNYLNKDASVYNTVNIGGYLEYYGYTASFDCRFEAFEENVCGVPDKLNDYLKFKHGYAYNDEHKLVRFDNDSVYAVIDPYDYIITAEGDFVLMVIDDQWEKIYEYDGYTLWKHIKTI